MQQLQATGRKWGGGDQGLGRAPEEGRGGWGRQGERAILGCWWGQSPQEGPDVGRKGLDFSLLALESHRRFQGIAAPWAEGPEGRGFKGRAGAAGGGQPDRRGHGRCQKENQSLGWAHVCSCTEKTSRPSLHERA